MQKYLPFLVGGLGVLFVVIALVLRNGTGDASVAITNLSSTFMAVAGAILILGGIVTFFLRDDESIW